MTCRLRKKPPNRARQMESRPVNVGDLGNLGGAVPPAILKIRTMSKRLRLRNSAQLQNLHRTWSLLELKIARSKVYGCPLLECGPNGETDRNSSPFPGVEIDRL